jgi:hypothetical protein
MGIMPNLVEDTSLPGNSRETFNPANALKLSRKEYPIVNSLFEKGLDFSGKIIMESRELERIENMFDYYLSNHLEKFGFLKTKNIIHELKN